MIRNSWKAVRFASLAVVFTGAQFSSALANAQIRATDAEPQYSTGDELKVIPYRAFGPLFYRKDFAYPVGAPWFSYFHLTDHAIALKPGVAANSGADESGWVPVPVKDGAVYYRAEYHLKDLADVSIDEYIADAAAVYRDSKATKRVRTDWSPSASQQQAFREKSKMQVVVYPTEQFSARYYPGSYLLRFELGSMTKSPLGSTRGGIAWKNTYGKTGKDAGDLAGVFKGTFDNIDCVRDGHLPGLIVDGKTVDAPLANLATLAVYEDGSFKMGPYTKLPSAGIRMLRQNEFPLLDGGELNIPGAYPVRWNRFEDDIMRSYMFMSADGKYIGYVWTNFTHPSFIAKVMKKLKFSDMMLMDIHPALGAAVRKPSARGQQPAEFFSGGSYPLVPMENDVINWAARTLGAAARGGTRIQWNYNISRDGSPNDFVAIYAK